MDTSAHILIADDSAFMRATLKNILETAGYTSIAEAGDGDACLAEIARKKPDLLLLDIIMPGKDGMAVLKEVGHSMPVVVITAVGQEQVMEDATALGARAYIVKPFAEKDVLATIGGVTS